MNELRVIIVEDELFAAEYLKEILERHAIEVLAIVDTGKDAIKVCVEKKPDVVFMDIMLNDNISGSEAAVNISRKIDTKIIFLTAYIDDEMVDYAVKAKAVGYLTKPYNETQIIATLRLATGQQNKPKDDIAEVIPDEIYLRNGYLFLREEQRLLKGGIDIEMGAKVRKVIALLSDTPNKLVSNEQISMHIWGEQVNDRTLRSLIYRVRSLTDEDFITNLSGMGYMLQTEEM